jgi:hypothetical protein
MATTLRELIAKVVFKADPAQLQDFDQRLDAAKQKLLGLDAQAKQGVSPNVDPTPLQQFGAQLQAAAAEMQALKEVGGAAGAQLGGATRTAGENFIALRDALRGVEGALDPEKAAQYSAAFQEAQQAAEDVRSAVNRLRLTDPKNPELPALERQLEAVELEAQQTAKALKGVGVATAQAAPQTSKLSKGLSDATKLLGGLGAAATAYKALAFGQQLVSEASAVGDLAAQLGIATDDLQTWTAFLEQAGGSQEELIGTVKTLSKNMQDVAQQGKGPAADAFKRLGLSTEGWKEKLPGALDMLLEAGGALAEVENDAERLALAQQLLGESSLKLLPAFEGGAEAAHQQLEELRELAVVYDQEFIKNSKAATNEMKLLERQLKGVGVSVLMDILPALRDFARWVTPVAKGVRDLVKNSNLLTAALGVGAGAGISLLLANLTKLGSVMAGAGRIFLRFILPLLVLDDIITFLRGGKSVLGDILDGMFGVGASKSVLEGLKKVWDGLAGGVKYFWGLLTGDKAAIEAGEAAILKFGGFIDDLFVKLGKTIDGWLTMFSEAFDFALKDLSAVFEGWIGDIATYFHILWGNIIGGLQSMLDSGLASVKSFASKLPLIGGLFDSDEPAGDQEGGRGRPPPPSEEVIERMKRAGRAALPPAAAVERMASNGRAALALGTNPAVNSSKSTNVTVNDNSSINTTLNGVDGKNVGAAVRASENNVKASLKRSRAQVLRQTVGAASP